MSDIFNPNGVQELLAGTNITLTPSSGVGIVTIASSGGGGGGESGVIVTSGANYTVNSVTAGSPFNVIVRKSSGSATTINIPAPDAAAPWGRVNVKDGKGDAGTNNITVTPASGNVDGASSFVIGTNYEGLSFLDDGTTWNIQ